MHGLNIEDEEEKVKYPFYLFTKLNFPDQTGITAYSLQYPIEIK